MYDKVNDDEGLTLNIWSLIVVFLYYTIYKYLINFRFQRTFLQVNFDICHNVLSNWVWSDVDNYRDSEISDW